MKALIVDDEVLARREMRHLLARHAEVVVIGEAGTVAEALALTHEHQPAVVFLDVELRGESGFDYAGRLDEPAPRLVFVTAHDRYAVRGFECNALDYLLKPVHPARLAETMRRLSDPPPLARPAADEDLLFLKTGGTARFVPWAEVLRITSEGNYTRVVLAKGGGCLVLRPLKEWIALAPAGQFLQVHRTALVRRAALREVRPTTSGDREVMLADGAVLPVGRSFWPELKSALGLD